MVILFFNLTIFNLFNFLYLKNKITFDIYLRVKFNCLNTLLDSLQKQFGTILIVNKDIFYYKSILTHGNGEY